MSILKSLEVKGRISQPKMLMEQNEYWGTVEKGESIRISAEAEGRVLVNGGDVLEHTPCVGLNVYKLTVEGLEGEFLVNIICREPSILLTLLVWRQSACRQICTFTAVRRFAISEKRPLRRKTF